MRKVRGEIFDKNREVVQILTSHPRFLKDIKQLRSWFDIPENGFVDEESAGTWFENLLQDENKFKDFRNMLSKAVSEFKLASNFISSVETYLLYNKILAPDSVYISMDFNKDLEQKELRVQVFGETREEDWRRIWHQIQKLQKYLPGYNPGRFRPKTNLLAEKMAYDMTMAGVKGSSEIISALEKAHLGSQYEVNKLVSSFRQRLKRFDANASGK